MDLMYMSDVMAYQTIRNPLYDRYNYDQPENNIENKTQSIQKKSKDKEPCKICQEKQRRSLMKYIRSKSHDHSELNIQEEEEVEEEKEEVQVKKEEKEETKRDVPKTVKSKIAQMMQTLQVLQNKLPNKGTNMNNENCTININMDK